MIFYESVTMPDGTIQEMSDDTLISDGNCLISAKGEYYHIHVGCCKKWSPEYRHNFRKFGGWRLTSIAVAKKLGYVPCLACQDELRDRQDFSYLNELDYDIDDDEY